MQRLYCTYHINNIIVSQVVSAESFIPSNDDKYNCDAALALDPCWIGRDKLRLSEEKKNLKKDLTHEKKL